jgi:hypothetical protein
MNLYSYVANNNPSMAKAICHKYGYKISGVQTKDDLGSCLEQLVAKEGEPALKDIVTNHPDREIIIEFSERDKVGTTLNHMGEQHNCPRCGRTPQSCVCGSQYKNYVNYIGDEKDVNVKPTRNESLVSQTNTFLLASAFLLGVAIISRK